MTSKTCRRVKWPTGRSIQNTVSARPRALSSSVIQTLRVTIAHLRSGEIELTMPFNAAHMQQHGFIHADIIATRVPRSDVS
jgi:acyl-coenzyme A thioesterase PaaI-like protein